MQGFGTAVWPDVITDAGLTCEFTWSVLAADLKTALPFDAGDYVRFKLADKLAGEPFLDLVTGAQSANGSEVTLVTQDGIVPASGKVIIAEGDTEGRSGKKYGELILVDVSEPETRRNKPIGRGVVIIRGSQGGDFGVP